MTPPDSDPDAAWRDAKAGDPRWRVTPTKWLVALILLVGIVVPLLVPTYAKVEPRLWGFPFFYWYQLVWVFLAAGLCGLAFALLRREHRAFTAAHPEDRDQTRPSDQTGGEPR